MTQMQLVWDSLSGPYRSLSDVDSIQLQAASVPSVRLQLEAIRSQAKALPAFVSQCVPPPLPALENCNTFGPLIVTLSVRYAAYRGLVERVDIRARTLHVITDLKSPAMQPRHWQSLARACNVSLSLDGLSLGLLWSSQLLQNEAAVREVLSVAQGEFALQEFLDAIKSHWSSCKFDMYTVGRRALNIKGWDVLFATLSEHVTNMSHMKASPYTPTPNIITAILFQISSMRQVLQGVSGECKRVGGPLVPHIAVHGLSGRHAAQVEYT